MKPYLVDVPVALYVFVRPDTLKKVFDVVKTARPSVLFLIGDGARENVPSDKENVTKSREIVEDIDWDCKVYKIYTEENCGMYATTEFSKKFIFEKVDRCIFLEDDIIVSISFFRYCSEILERYKNDLRVHYVTGMNYIGKYEEPSSDYFFANEGSIWGFATWRRVYEQQNHNYREDKYVLDKLKDITKKERKDHYKRIVGYSKENVYEGHIACTEYFKEFFKFSQNQVFIVPTKNMVSNIGVTENSTHAPNDIRKLPKMTQGLFNMEIYEYDFPLKHPKYLIRDLSYEGRVRKIMAWNHPVIACFRFIERIIRYIYYGDMKILFSKYKNKFFKIKTFEK